MLVFEILIWNGELIHINAYGIHQTKSDTKIHIVNFAAPKKMLEYVHYSYLFLAAAALSLCLLFLNQFPT